MSQKKVEEKKANVEKKIKEQKVLQSELESLRKGTKVYRKQQNSKILFVSNIDAEMKRSKKTMDDLINEYDSLEGPPSGAGSDDPVVPDRGDDNSGTPIPQAKSSLS